MDEKGKSAKETIEGTSREKEEVLKQKEEDWMKKCKECEEKSLLVALAMKDYDIVIKWDRN